VTHVGKRGFPRGSRDLAVLSHPPAVGLRWLDHADTARGGSFPPVESGRVGVEDGRTGADDTGRVLHDRSVTDHVRDTHLVDLWPGERFDDDLGTDAARVAERQAEDRLLQLRPLSQEREYLD